MKDATILSRAGAQQWGDYLKSWGAEPVVISPLVLVVLFILAGIFDPDALSALFAAVVAISPIWLPIFLFKFFWITWITYIRYTFWFAQPMVVLEIKLPPEVEKSPLAMELFLSSLWNSGGETTFIHRIWKGQFRPVWTLEIASNEGQISFYMHVRRAFKNVVEARLYGQYPEAHVEEVEDYVTKVPFNLEEYDLWGCEYDKGSPQALPIKTYIDYGLNEAPDKPEVQVDPITNILEVMSVLGKDEHLWMQIIIRARKKDEWFGFYSEVDKFKKGAKDGIEQIFKGAVDRTEARVGDEAAKKSVASRGITLLSEGEKRRVDSIERSLSKLVFECGFRNLYIAKHSRFKGPTISALIRFYDAYKYPDYNGLGASRGLADYNYPWQDFMNIRQTLEKKRLWFRFKNRAYFFVPFDQSPVFMTTEELATIWHFPSSVVKTPTLDRVSSRVSEAPANLPTASS